MRPKIERTEQFISANTPLCSGCKKEPRLPGQRYGRFCRNDAQRKHQEKMRKALHIVRNIKHLVDD